MPEAENDELDEEKLHEPKKKQLEYVNFMQKKIWRKIFGSILQEILPIRGSQIFNQKLETAS